MFDPDPVPDPEADLQEMDTLDRGLAAAFGVDSAPGEAVSVIDRLERRLGVASRVLLRDEPDAESPVVAVRETEAARAGRYQVHGEIARGGVGIVMKGRDVDLGRDVAMKVLQEEHADDPRMVQRFVEEAQIAGQLQHPGVLPVYELGLRTDRRPYFAMKLVKGRTLQAILAERPDPQGDLARCVSVFLQVCNTVAYAHARGVVHRDLKPSNVMVGAYGEVLVVDWGLAKVLAHGGLADERAARDESSEDHDTVVRTVRAGSHSVAGSVLGTPAYMAPEQARGQVDRVDERTDVFALGGILCEILTGKPPYVGSGRALIDAATDARLDNAHARLDACPADAALVDLARRCLSPERRDRPRSAQAVADAVSAHLAGSAERARRAEIEAAEARTRVAHERRSRRLVLALAAVVITVVALSAAAMVAYQSERGRRTRAVNDALAAGEALLAEARTAAATDESAWPELRAMAEVIEDRLATEWVDRLTADRGAEFLADFRHAERDRAMIELVEELVIFGATHDDVDSWLRMERELREAYAAYGLDLVARPKDEIAAAIRRSPLAAQLTNGLELWVATAFQLAHWNASPYTMDELMSWVQVLLDADPDPYRTAVRELLYSHDPSVDRARLDELAASPEFEAALPRTLSWLASIYWRVGDVPAGLRVFDRALALHPGDMMLNFDHAYFLVAAERWQEATRAYHRALAVRPDAAGVWRSLASALRETGEPAAALDALDHSIALQGDYAPTWIDRGAVQLGLEAYADAEASFQTALELDPDSTAAQRGLEESRAALDAADPETP